MGEAASATTFVVGDRLPWPDDGIASEIKGSFEAGAIHHGGSRRECSIRKISALGVMVGVEIASALGDQVAVELGTGQRSSGKIAWTGRSELGIRFDDAIDVIALINRNLVSQPAERRTMPRVEIRCPCYLKCGGKLMLASIRNISSKGIQLEGEELPETGTYVTVLVEGLNIPGAEVVWRRDKLAGVELMEELSWSSIVSWVRVAVRQSAS
ncbi:MAG: PilZ domain-containing protein [Sphingomonas sp.]|nr:PilZ domain-containing protein [Sphingomonas sp.]MBW0006176.1 PilZ domain-containing protein [Sphingomonas sp.]